VYSIRVISYVGDLEDADEIIVIGPYFTEAARDMELSRLGAMSTLGGDFRFDSCDIPVGLNSVTSVNAGKVAALPNGASSDTFGAVIWGR
jgi:hypothetical protein